MAAARRGIDLAIGKQISRDVLFGTIESSPPQHWAGCRL
jgi:hypothetical protein